MCCKDSLQYSIKGGLKLSKREQKMFHLNFDYKNWCDETVDLNSNNITYSLTENIHKYNIQIIESGEKINQTSMGK